MTKIIIKIRELDGKFNYKWALKVSKAVIPTCGKVTSTPETLTEVKTCHSPSRAAGKKLSRESRPCERRAQEAPGRSPPGRAGAAGLPAAQWCGLMPVWCPAPRESAVVLWAMLSCPVQPAVRPALKSAGLSSSSQGAPKSGQQHKTEVQS